MLRTAVVVIAGALALAACGAGTGQQRLQGDASGASHRSGYDERDPAYRGMPGDQDSPTTLGQSVRDE